MSSAVLGSLVSAVTTYVLPSAVRRGRVGRWRTAARGCATGLR
ncbi:hypothetical protein [Microbispora rosea]|nr:hypothetical protein [Microbispora rosea]